MVRCMLCGKESGSDFEICYDCMREIHRSIMRKMSQMILLPRPGEPNDPLGSEIVQRIVDAKEAQVLLREGFLVKQELQSGLLVLEKRLAVDQIANDALIQEKARLQKL